MEKNSYLIRCLFWFFVSIWVIVQYVCNEGSIPVMLTLCGTGCCSLLYLEKYFDKKENK